MMQNREKVFSFLPFLEDLRSYSWFFFKRDFFAALSVALLAIPQSIAYSLLAGLPPLAGLYSSIFGTIFTAAFGSSRLLVASASTGVSILIQTTLSQILSWHYPDAMGMEKEILTMQILTQVVLFVGLLQILIGALNLSKLLQFVSRSVVLGYLVGIALAIFVNQLYYLLGLGSFVEGGSILTKALNLGVHFMDANFSAVIVSIGTMMIFIALRKRFIKGPNALITLIVMSFIAYGLNRFLATAHLWKFSSIRNFADLGFTSTPMMIFSLPEINLDIFSSIFFGALAIALLSILEVFSISRTLATKSGERVLFNQETFALGISNTFLSFLNWAMPVSGSFSRSYVNYENRAKTRFSAIMSGILVAALVYFCWPLVQQVPLAALAAILIVIVFSLLDWQEVKLAIFSTRADASVFCMTTFSCLVFRLDIAFFIGIVISILLFLKKAASFHLVEYNFDSAGRLILMSGAKEIYTSIRIVSIGGEMFFAAVDLFEKAMQTIRDDPYSKVLILRLNGVYHMDASMCLAILRLSEYLRSVDKHLLISGISDEVLEVFQKADLIAKMGKDSFFLADETKPQLSTWKAYRWAKELIEQEKR